MTDAEIQARIHDRLVAFCVREIVAMPLAAGGSSSDVMTLLASVAAGIIEAMARHDGAGAAKREDDLRLLASRVRVRLSELDRKHQMERA